MQTLLGSAEKKNENTTVPSHINAAEKPAVVAPLETKHPMPAFHDTDTPVTIWLPPNNNNSADAYNSAPQPPQDPILKDLFTILKEAKRLDGEEPTSDLLTQEISMQEDPPETPNGIKKTALGLKAILKLVEKMEEKSPQPGYVDHLSEKKSLLKKILETAENFDENSLEREMSSLLTDISKITAQDLKILQQTMLGLQNKLSPLKKTYNEELEALKQEKRSLENSDQKKIEIEEKIVACKKKWGLIFDRNFSEAVAVLPPKTTLIFSRYTQLLDTVKSLSLAANLKKHLDTGKRIEEFDPIMGAENTTHLAGKDLLLQTLISQPSLNLTLPDIRAKLLLMDKYCAQGMDNDDLPGMTGVMSLKGIEKIISNYYREIKATIKGNTKKYDTLLAHKRRVEKELQQIPPKPIKPKKQSSFLGSSKEHLDPNQAKRNQKNLELVGIEGELTTSEMQACRVKDEQAEQLSSYLRQRAEKIKSEVDNLPEPIHLSYLPPETKDSSEEFPLKKLFTTLRAIKKLDEEAVLDPSAQARSMQEEDTPPQEGLPETPNVVQKPVLGLNAMLDLVEKIEEKAPQQNQVDLNNKKTFLKKILETAKSFDEASLKQEMSSLLTEISELTVQDLKSLQGVMSALQNKLESPIKEYSEELRKLREEKKVLLSNPTTNNDDNNKDPAQQGADIEEKIADCKRKWGETFDNIFSETAFPPKIASLFSRSMQLVDTLGSLKLATKLKKHLEGNKKAEEFNEGVGVEDVVHLGKGLLLQTLLSQLSLNSALPDIQAKLLLMDKYCMQVMGNDLPGKGSLLFGGVIRFKGIISNYYKQIRRAIQQEGIEKYHELCACKIRVQRALGRIPPKPAKPQKRSSFLRFLENPKEPHDPNKEKRDQTNSELAGIETQLATPEMEASRARDDQAEELSNYLKKIAAYVEQQVENTSEPTTTPSLCLSSSSFFPGANGEREVPTGTAVKSLDNG